MNRRTFLKLVGMGSMSIAAGCSPYSEKNFYSLIHHPDDMVIGSATWYASTCRECPAGCGILAKNREGRVIKVEGNPQHPINRGKLCMRGQAALQAVFNPDRLKTPLLKENDRFKPISFRQAQALIKEKADTAAANGSDRVRMVTETVGETVLKLFSESLSHWHSKEPLVFCRDDRAGQERGCCLQRDDLPVFPRFGIEPGDDLRLELNGENLFARVDIFDSCQCAAGKREADRSSRHLLAGEGEVVQIQVEPPGGFPVVALAQAVGSDFAVVETFHPVEQTRSRDIQSRVHEEGV